MIPDHSLSGVLPPFVGENPANRAEASPYLASMSEFVQRFCTTMERARLLSGLLKYRSGLANLMVRDGMQWIDGSFLEEVEATRKRPPQDIDLITLAHRPETHQTDQDWELLFRANIGFFVPSFVKETFHCDAYFIDLDKRADILIKDVCYFHGLFSHQRDTLLWKGIVEIPLESDDDIASTIVEEVLNAQET
jgi:hypothetical protein